MDFRQDGTVGVKSRSSFSFCNVKKTICNVIFMREPLIAYNAGGNVTTKTVNGSPILFGYDTTNNDVWRDRLTSYNGATIGNYDACGNPQTYRGFGMSWTRGRLLSSYKNAGYTYNKESLYVQPQ